MNKKFEQFCFSDDGYWRSKSIIQKLSKASGSTKEEAEKWLLKQPCTKYIYHLQSTFLDPKQQPMLYYLDGGPKTIFHF